MRPWQNDVGGHWTDCDRVVAHPRDALISRPVVRHQLGLGGYRTEDESMDLLFAKTLDHFQSGAPRLAAIDFDCAGDQHLADPTAACRYGDRVVLGAEGNDRFIRLDDTAQRLPLRVDHGPAQFGA